MFEAVDAWERVEGGLIRYRCFRALADGRYWVQSADYYRPGMPAADIAALDRQFVELLAEGGPAERGATAATLAEAVERFRRSFPG